MKSDQFEVLLHNNIIHLKVRDACFRSELELDKIHVYNTAEKA